MTGIIYNRVDYQKAKKLLEGATIVPMGYCSTIYSRTQYEKEGKFYVEFESHLEAPMDDYTLYEVDKLN